MANRIQNTCCPFVRLQQGREVKQEGKMEAQEEKIEAEKSGRRTGEIGREEEVE